MNKYFVSFIIVSLILGISCFIVLDNILYAIIVFLVSSLYLIVFDMKKLKENDLKIERYHECLNFINTFVISLSISGSISSSFISSSQGCSSFCNKEIEAINDLSEEEKIRYLEKYFIFQDYKVFIDILNLFMEEGGDILTMSRQLLSSMQETEDYILFCSSLNKRKMLDFAILWAFCIVILIVVRYSLLEFYTLIMSNVVYKIGIIAILLFITISLDILLRKTSNMKLRGWGK